MNWLPPLTRLSAAVAVLGLAIGLGLLAAPAGAVGNVALSKVIIANPVAGWQPESTASLDRVVTYINGLEAASIVPKGGNAITAVEGWTNPADHRDYVVIALVALRLSGDAPSAVANHTSQGDIAALASLCAAGALQSSVQASTVAGVPGSHTLSCTVRGATAKPYAAGWSKSNVLALVLSVQGAVSAPQLAAIATSQYAAMSPAGFTVGAAPGGGSGVLKTLLELLLGLVIVIGAGYALWKVLQRANASAVTPEVRRGTVQRPASLAGGVPSSSVKRPRPQP
jgi:hypothetical protein